MIAYARIFTSIYQNILKSGFSESFSKWNVINRCVKGKGVFL